MVTFWTYADESGTTLRRLIDWRYIFFHRIANEYDNKKRDITYLQLIKKSGLKSDHIF